MALRISRKSEILRIRTLGEFPLRDGALWAYLRAAHRGRSRREAGALASVFGFQSGCRQLGEMDNSPREISSSMLCGSSTVAANSLWKWKVKLVTVWKGKKGVSYNRYSICVPGSD